MKRSAYFYEQRRIMLLRDERLTRQKMEVNPFFVNINGKVFNISKNVAFRLLEKRFKSPIIHGATGIIIN